MKTNKTFAMSDWRGGRTRVEDETASQSAGGAAIRPCNHAAFGCGPLVTNRIYTYKLPVASYESPVNHQLSVTDYLLATFRISTHLHRNHSHLHHNPCHHHTPVHEFEL